MKIILDANPSDAPCCVKVLNEDKSDSVLFQTDWDWPSLASVFGWSSCKCGETDGTVGCAHKTAGEMISEAREYIDAHDGETAEDPGYFN